MIPRLQDKNRAIELRKQGLSYKEIQQYVTVSKGLLSRWLSYLPLTSEEENRLRLHIQDQKNRGKVATLIANRTRRIGREQLIIKDAEKKFKLFKGNPFFFPGIMLYWAEGSKRTGRFQFINSDPEMILFMYRWVQKFLLVSKREVKVRLFIHQIPGYEGIQEFWAKILGIEPSLFQKTIYKPTGQAIKKNPLYKGCLRIDISGIHHLRLMKAWQKLLIQYYDEAFNKYPW